VELSTLPLLTENDEQDLAIMASNRKVRESEAAQERTLWELEQSELLGKPGPLDVNVTLKTYRRLGMHVDLKGTDGLVKVAGVSPDGELAKALPPGLRLHHIIGVSTHCQTSLIPRGGSA